MKTSANNRAFKAFLFLVAPAVLLPFILGGCVTRPSTAAQQEGAETTRLFESQTAKGDKTLRIDFAKELASTTLNFTIDPATGKIQLVTTGLQTSASAPINAAGQAEANAIAQQGQAITAQTQAMTNFMGQALPVLAKAGAAAVSAAVPAAAPIATAAANAIQSPPAAAPITAPPVTLAPAASGRK